MENKAEQDKIIFSAISKLAIAGRAVGLSPDDLIRLLNEGMTIAQIIEYINREMSGTAFAS